MYINKTVDLLREGLRDDSSFYKHWQHHIASSFEEEYHKSTVRGDEGYTFTPSAQDIHQISNQAAKNFLDLLIK